MSKTILLVAVLVILIVVLGMLAPQGTDHAVVPPTMRATDALPFGPGLAADYGTQPDDENLDGLDVRIERLLHKKRP